MREGRQGGEGWREGGGRERGERGGRERWCEREGGEGLEEGGRWRDVEERRADGSEEGKHVRSCIRNVCSKLSVILYSEIYINTTQ